MAVKKPEKYLKISYTHYRKLLRDSYRLATLKQLVKKAHNITKRVDSPIQGRNTKVEEL